MNRLHRFAKYFLIFFLIPSLLFAESAKEEISKTKKEENESKEGEKEGSSGFIKKDEYLELNSSIEQMSAKIKSRSEDLKKQLLDKEKIKDSSEFKKIVKEIESTYREIKELSETIEKKKAIIRHRFPERSFVRNNDKTKFQNIEDLSEDAILEKQVEQLLAIVETQYQYQIRKKQNPVLNNQRVPASENGHESSQEKESQNPYDFSHSLILKK